MVCLTMSVLLLPNAPELGASFDKIEKAAARVESEKNVTSIRGLKGLLGQFKRSLAGVRRDLTGDKPANKKAVTAKVGSLQRQAESIHHILRRADQRKPQEQWLEIRREIDAIGAHVGVKPKLEPDDSPSTLAHDTEKLEQRVRRFYDSLKASRSREVGKIRFHANAVYFQLGRLARMAGRDSSKAKDMKAAWKKLLPELNDMVAKSKRQLPRTYQREAEAIDKECKALNKRYP